MLLFFYIYDIISFLVKFTFLTTKIFLKNFLENQFISYRLNRKNKTYAKIQTTSILEHLPLKVG